MTQERTANVIAHYTRRHEFRGDLYGDQPFANYGYWSRQDLSLEQAAEALTRLVASSAGLGPGDRVLDVGCGYGAGAVHYMQSHAPDEVIGIDVTPVRIDSGREYIERHGMTSKITLQMGDATKMDFAAESFTKLISVECAFHFDTRKDFFSEAARVLQPGGSLALTDIIPCRGVNPDQYQRGQAAQVSNVCLEMPENAYDADVYAEHLKSAGFTDVRIESILNWTRAPFVQALRRLAAHADGERGDILKRMATNNQRQVDSGEDYVLVTARKSG